MNKVKEKSVMKMTIRWFPGGDDSVALEQIRQIPGVSGVAAMLSDIPVGEIWPARRLKILNEEVQDAGLSLEVIESVNIHEDIKKGLASRDLYIDNYNLIVRINLFFLHFIISFFKSNLISDEKENNNYNRNLI